MSIKIQNLSFSIHGNHLVSIPEWHLENGKIYGLCGDTGSGKSTIGRWLAKVEPEYWSVESKNDSEIRIDKGKNGSNSLNSLTPLYLLQDAYQIFNPYISIETHFRDIWKNQLSHAQIEYFDEIYSILLDIGIVDPRSLLERKVHQVSQGEAQRMAFVLGLIRPASIRIYDEVFSNVDEEASKAMLTFLRKFCTITNSTAIVISHETTYYEEFMDATYQIQKGILEKVSLLSFKSLHPMARMEYPPFIEIQNLALPSYLSGKSNHNNLWHILDFSICRSECVGLFGNSGVGKTTFLRSLLGEHPLNWSECRISTKSNNHIGNDLSTLDIRYLPQSVVSAFNPAYPIKTTLRELQDVYGVDNEDLLNLLNRFGLQIIHLENYPNELSGGEIQRIGVLTVLLGNPDLILLDESFSSVDHKTREIIWTVLMKEQQDKLFSLLVVSHDIFWLKDNMNRLYEMDS